MCDGLFVQQERIVHLLDFSIYMSIARHHNLDKSGEHSILNDWNCSRQCDRLQVELDNYSTSLIRKLCIDDRICFQDIFLQIFCLFRQIFRWLEKYQIAQPIRILLQSGAFVCRNLSNIFFCDVFVNGLPQKAQ